MDQGHRQRFELLVEKFTEQMKVLGWSPRTIDSYRSHLGFFLAWLDQETDVEAITAVTPEVLHAWQTHLYGFTDENGKGLSIATQAARLSVLRSFFRYLVKSDVLLYDPSSGLETRQSLRSMEPRRPS